MGSSSFGNSAINIIQFFTILLVLVTSQPPPPPPFSSSPALSITTDKEALLSLKSQFLVEIPNNPLSTWDQQNLSPCNWSGVSCTEQRVTGLDLSGLRMAGSISPYLGNLSSLRSLHLQNNQLTGIIPDQIGGLSRLTNLNLSFNSINGEIPPAISRCRDLTTLELTQNRIWGRIPHEISQLTQLQTLNLAGNQLTGDIPPSFTNISSLVDLNLGTNNLGPGTIPDDLWRLSNLKFLDLTINNFSGRVPPSMYNMSSLVYVALASNNFWGELPPDIGTTLPNLLGFNFCFNKFTGTIPSSLHNLTNIQIIRIAHNLLHGSIPPGLGNLPNLEMYNIGFNRIVGNFDFLELLSNSTRLNFLTFDYNLFEGEIPNSIGNLSKVLTKLYMGGNNIYGTIPPSIGELRSLDLLNMSYSTFISGEVPPQIGLLKELRVLGLADNNLSGKIPDSLGNLQFLTKIDLSRNKFVGSIPSTFGNLQNLISMDLSDNMLNGSIPVEILNLPGLSSFLNLSRNQLTGSIPVEIGSLEKVAVVNISDNMLSGNIPNSIGMCQSLEQLSLARNMLSGPIPDTLASVKGLETLDLSRNQLTGKVPSNLQNLQSLQFLNLSFNNLEGQIPSGGIFKDLSKVHFDNNKRLCSGLSCEIPGRRRKSTFTYILISVAALVSICFAVGLIWYIRKGKKMTKKGPFDHQSVKGQPQMISYDELRVATGNFSDENLIGHGSFGLVYRGVVQGVTMAVKVLNNAVAKPRKTFLAECAALRNVRHRNLVKLVTVCSSIDSKKEEFLALVFEFMSNGSLDDWITGKRKHANGTIGMNALDRVKCAIGIASAIDYLHNETEVPIVHCDLKPSNVLLDSDMTPKVADFGLAKLLLDTDNNQISLSYTHTLRGSIGYIPPEYGYGERPSTAGDVYSYGILLLELFAGKSPTCEIFTEGLTLKSWVENQFLTDVEKVLEIGLVEEMNDYWEEEEEDGRDCSKLESWRECLTTVVGIGLSCAAESADARISIKEALRKLKNVEEILDKHRRLVGENIC
ncbi:hypothetical protein MIMGU_mgv1a000660mg [Erythranthe guttata]|uniref:non-specific serine/threonine protein kinase n=2 Tax=Erythranthe guttata TaxID=4155 RepID=A0A022RBQ7_ERYGU|nr:hypothetical protein MIMGU_mgv1a000660mg [Erythranthe guttata]